MEAPPGDAQASEYETLWAAVRQHGATFETWEKLVKFSLSSGDIEKIREVFDDFLARYPLCYAYWRQYANAEVAHGGTAEPVLERGVTATPYSTDLWLEYIDRVSKRDGDHTADTRTLFTRAAQYVSIDWLAHKLLDKWIAFEERHGTVPQVVQVHTTALGLPMKDSARLHTAFCDYVSGRPLADMAKRDKVAAAQAMNDEGTGHDAAAAAGDETAAAAVADAPPGTGDADAPPRVDQEASAQEALANVEVSDDEVKAAWLEAHNRVFERTLVTLERRRQYEAHIKRRWWNFKPMEAEQLLTWWLYLDEVAAEGSETVMYGLFERCLVPCASYPEFWCRYLCFLRSATTLSDAPTIVRFAASRASQIFCASRPDCLLCCALVHELQGDVDAARALHTSIREHAAPRLIEGASRSANFERRNGDVAGGVEILRALFRDFKAAGDVQSALWLAQQIAAMQVVTHGSVDESADGATAAVVVNGNAAANTTAGTQQSVGGHTTAEIEELLVQQPHDVSVWAAAVSSAELRLTGAARAEAVVALCRRALSATVPPPDGDAASAAAQPLALSLDAREAQVASAMAAVDLYGTPGQMWEVLGLSVWLQREVLHAAATVSRKRGATGYEQPDAKRQMGAEYAYGVQVNAQAAGHHYAQQGHEYSAYYQQQAYYGYSAQ